MPCYRWRHINFCVVVIITIIIIIIIFIIIIIVEISQLVAGVFVMSRLEQCPTA